MLSKNDSVYLSSAEASTALHSYKVFRLMMDSLKKKKKIQMIHESKMGGAIISVVSHHLMLQYNLFFAF